MNFLRLSIMLSANFSDLQIFVKKWVICFAKFQQNKGYKNVIFGSNLISLNNNSYGI